MTNEPAGDILTSTTNDIGTLTISNPKLRNAMNLSMYKKVPSAIDSLIASGVKVIVVRGDGDDAFGAGSDISEFETLRTPDNAHAYDDAEADAHESIEKSSVPTIAMINGPCRGGGLAIALACDLRYASDAATFAAPPAKLGIAFPHPAVEALAKTVGDAHARYLLLTASTVDAQEAQRIGLIHHVTTGASLPTVVNDLTAQISQLAPQSLTAAKISLAAINGHATNTDVQNAIRKCYESSDYQEGITAFVEKRNADFDGT